MQVPEVETYRELGEAAWSWVQGQLRDEDGPWLPEHVTGEPVTPSDDRDSLYAGIGGLAPTMAEIAQYRELEPAELSLQRAILDRLSRQAGTRLEPSLYDGLAGDVTALRMLAPGSEGVALRRLLELMTEAGWESTYELEPGVRQPMNDLVMGNAGVVLAGVWAGGADGESIAGTGCDALLRGAERTPAGLNWRMVPNSPDSGPNYSHGTAGVASALAVAGTVLHCPELVDAAIEGAQHLLHIASLADDGLIIPHTIPPSRREVEPVTYTWCHGPTGTSHLFVALERAGVGEVAGHPVGELRRRCFNSILGSGLPQRLRPGFWDNDGRCCGTAGVGDALLDAAQDSADPAWAETLLDSACTMGDALVERVVRDDDGARWRFIEYRQEEPLLPPGTAWMQGAAGIAAFLLRLSRVLEGGLRVPVVDRPDEWWAVPADVRTVHTA